jgi:RecA DNA recombination protein
MSSAVVSTSAALGRPFVFEDEAYPEVSRPAEPAQGRPPQPVRPAELSGDLASTDPRLARVTSASHLEIRSAPEMASSGIPALDSLTGGLPRGCLTEICGPASSGRTTVLLAALAAATRRGEYCAVIDASDALDPHSAAASGIDLERLLWVRCGEDSPQSSHSKQSRAPISRAPSAREACPELVEWVGISSQASFEFDQRPQKKNAWTENMSHQSEHRLEQLLRATDLLLESGGFGLIVLDLSDLPPQSARRIPLTTWFRFRRAVEHKPTILLAIEQHPIAGSCSTLLLQLGVQNDSEEATQRTQIANPTHANLLDGLNVHAELARSRIDRKPAHSVAFATKTAWAG